MADLSFIACLKNSKAVGLVIIIVIDPLGVYWDQSLLSPSFELLAHSLTDPESAGAEYCSIALTKNFALTFIVLSKSRNRLTGRNFRRYRYPPDALDYFCSGFTATAGFGFGLHLCPRVAT
jgi:hypothetical protein